MGYSGSPQYQYWVQFVNDGVTANNGLISENIAVVPGTVVTLNFTASTSVAWTQGFGVQIAWYSSTGSIISSTPSLTQTNTAAGTIYTLTSNGGSNWTVPSGTSYGIIRTTFNGTPSTSDLMNMYQCLLQDSNGVVLNANANFYYTAYPWALALNGSMQWNYSKFLEGDFDSLVVAGQIELLGGFPGIPCQIPELLDSNGVGPTFRILAPPSLNSTGYGYESSYDLNAPQPTQDVVASMLLDGERPFGYRASNRTITLPLIIKGTNAGGMGQVLKAQEFIMQLTDQQVFETIWTPADTGLPLVFDCFRALPSTQFYGFNYNQGNANTEAVGKTNAPLGAMTIQFQALPYGRSDVDGIQSIAFSNPIINGQTAATVQPMDYFNTLQSGNSAQWTHDTRNDPVTNYTGHSVHYTPPNTKPYAAATYSGDCVNNIGTPISVNLTNCPSLHYNVGLAYDTQWPAAPSWKCNLTFNWTLTDNNGYSIKFGATNNSVPYGPNSNSPKWSSFTANIPRNSRFNYSNVVSYSVTVTNWAGSGTTGLIRTHLWLNFLESMPWSITNPASPRGNVYNLLGLPGTARAPININCQLPAQSPTTQEFTTAGNGTWTVPDYVYNVMAECIGGGGAGSSVSSAIAGAGAGGAEYAAETGLIITPSTAIPWSVGSGGIAAQLNPTVVTFTTTGLNHWTCPAGVTTAKVEVWGAGAAGAAGGGGGGGGKYESTQLTVTPGTTYYANVGAYGKPNTGKTAADNSSRNGGTSWFNSRNHVPVSGTDTGYPAGQGGSSPLTGSSSGGNAGGGGSPATSATRYNGGAGGASPGAAGGGGGAGGGSTAKGNNGAASPSTNKYTIGGAGGAGATDSGAGGSGANSPGVPQAGSKPGGGGGGGYTSGANYIGARGADGQVRVTYAVGNGTQVNGTATSFGSATTTFLSTVGTTVTANGATSVAANTSTATSGASGSTNTTHFNGGSGYPNSSVSPYYALVSDYSKIFANLGNASGTGGTATFTAASGYNGGAIAILVATPAFDSTMAVTDSVGNTYSLQQTSTASNGATVQVFAGQPIIPITTSTTFTATGTTSQNVLLAALISKYLNSPVSGNINFANGSSTTPTITAGTGDNVSLQAELMVFMNNSTATASAPTTGTFAAASTNTWADGTLELAAYTSINQGGTADSSGITISTSSPWAAVCVPFANANQDVVPAIIGTGTAASATTAVSTLKKGAGAGGGLILVEVRQAANIAVSAVSDTASNTYTLVKEISTSSADRIEYWSAVSNATGLVPANTVTTTFASAATAATTVYYFPGVESVDATAVTTNTGTSTAPSVTVPAQGSPNDLLFVSFSNISSLHVSGTGAPWLEIFQTVSGTAYTDSFVAQQVGSAAVTFSATLASSVAWQAVSIGLNYGVVGGGGGASAGPTGAGWSALSQLGAPGNTGGGKGGQGTVAGSSASVPGAAVPGGGGGGASATSSLAAGSAAIGGNGGAGLIRLTWQPPLMPFNDLVVHKPGYGASPNLSPLQTIPISDTPTNIEYTVQSISSIGNAQFNSTYSVLLIANTWNSPGNARNVTVTINQYEYQGGPAYTVQCTRTLTPTTDIVNGYVAMGEVTLPVKEIPPGNDQAYFTFSVHDTNTSDRFQDVLFLDTTGETVIVNIPSGSPAYGQYVNYFIDEPTPDRDLGTVAGTYINRKASIGVLDYALLSGGPLYVDPGDNLLLTYSTSGAPNLGVTYSPRWYNSRTV